MKNYYCNHTTRDVSLLNCCRHLLKNQHSLIVRSKNDSSTPNQEWTVVPTNTLEEYRIPQDWTVLFTTPPSKSEYTSITTLAHQILDDDNDDDVNDSSAAANVASLQRQLQARFAVTLGTDIRGRAAADAAFALALAGVSHGDNDDSTRLFRRLYQVVRLELERVLRHHRRQKARDLLHICEKVAASGAGWDGDGDGSDDDDDDDVARIYQLVADALLSLKNDVDRREQQKLQKQQHHYFDSDTAVTLLSTSYGRIGSSGHTKSKGSSSSSSNPAELGLDLLHPRSLLWLWRFSSRLTKPQQLLGESSMDTNNDEPQMVTTTTRVRASSGWRPTFHDNHRPLVLDLGCGLGVSLLGLASQQDGAVYGEGSPCSNRDDDADDDDPRVCSARDPLWTDCNFLGGDLNPRTTRFATGIARRWQRRLNGNLHSDGKDGSNHHHRRLEYCTISTEDLLDAVEANYPGRVALVMLQFPTPYRLENDKDDNAKQGEAFNTQLPDGPTSKAFMASPLVLRKVSRLLKRKGGSGRLLVQSNCEDVAIRIRDMALQEGLRCVPANSPVTRLPLATERTQRWLENNNNDNDDSDDASRRGATTERAVGRDWWSGAILPCQTETEAACELQGTPVHRCLFEVIQ